MHDWDMLLNRLDLTHPGLIEARRLMDSGATSRCRRAVLSHFRDRRRPAYLFDEHTAARFTDAQIVREADRICAHDILGYRLGDEIDWRFNATVESSKDPEWLWSLFRHGFWVTLGRAYMVTGDEKYAREFVRQLKGFVKSWPVEPYMTNSHVSFTFPGDAWRPIEAAIRIYTSWLPTMVYFRQSPSWDEEGWMCFLNSLHDHGEFLLTQGNSLGLCSNWRAMESTALFLLGVMFPEFKRAPEWRSLGYRRVSHEVRFQFDHDGVHIERTPVYHLAAAAAFLQAYRIAVLNGIPVPPYMLPILEKSAEFLMQLVKPDCTLPMVGDADRESLLARKADESVYEGMNLTSDPLDLNEIRAFFRVMGELTGRQDFMYLGAGGKEGSPPTERSFALPHSGFYIFRTGWRDNDSYFMVTGAVVEKGENCVHSHHDAGHLELHVAGEDVLIDPGRFVYGDADLKDWRTYFRSTAAHNTVQVDRCDSDGGPGMPPGIRAVRAFCHRFDTSPGVEVIEVSHNGYAFLPEPVFHRRCVIHLKPGCWLIDDVLTGAGEHEYRLCFNFAPGRLERLEHPHVYAYTGRKVRVRFVPLLEEGIESATLEGSDDPQGGWVSYGYGKKVPAPQLVYTKTATTPARFVTAVLTEGQASIVSAETGDETTMSLRVNSGGKDWDTVLELDKFELRERDRGR